MNYTSDKDSDAYMKKKRDLNHNVFNFIHVLISRKTNTSNIWVNMWNLRFKWGFPCIVNKVCVPKQKKIMQGLIKRLGNFKYNK